MASESLKKKGSKQPHSVVVIKEPVLAKLISGGRPDSPLAATSAMPSDAVTSDLDVARLLPAWLRYLFYMIIGSAIILLPTLYIWWRYPAAWYWPPVTDPSQEVTDWKVFEVFRWSLVAAAVFATYLAFLSLIAFIPFAIRLTEMLSGREVLKSKPRQRLKHFLVLRRYMSVACAAFVLWIGVSALLNPAYYALIKGGTKHTTRVKPGKGTFEESIVFPVASGPDNLHKLAKEEDEQEAEENARDDEIQVEVAQSKPEDVKGNEEKAENVKKSGDDAKDSEAGKDVEEGGPALQGLMMTASKAVGEIESVVSFKYSYEFYVTRLSLAIFLFTLLLLFEKFITQRIAVNFHRAYYADRIEDNAFGVEAANNLKKLYPAKERTRRRHRLRSLLSPGRTSQSPSPSPPRTEGSATSVSSDSQCSVPDELGLQLSSSEVQEASELAAALFGDLCPASRDYLLPVDFQPAFPHSAEDALRFFNLLDRDSNGDITEKEMIRSIDWIFAERELLSQYIAGSSQVIKQLDTLGVYLAFVLTLLIGLAVFSASAITSLIALGGLAMNVDFVFSDTLENSFASLIFVFATHPFDIGDVVQVDDRTLTVRNIGFWMTSFYGPNNVILYMSNVSLSEAKITNFRRSPPQQDSQPILLSTATPTSAISLLEEKLNDFMARHPRDYIGCVQIKDFEVQDAETMKAEIEYCHRSNFQNGGIRGLRNNAFFEYMRIALQECQIQLAPYSRPLISA